MTITYKSVDACSDVGGPSCDDPLLNAPNGGKCHYVVPNASDARAIPPAQVRKIRAGYAGAVTWVDLQVGVLLDALEASGAWNDTVVVLFGDHGWALGEHGIFCKQANFELETRVPLILRVPWLAGGSGGGATAELAELVDVFPTLLSLAGLLTADAVPDVHELQGISLVPVLEHVAAQRRAAQQQGGGEGGGAVVEALPVWRNGSFSQYPRCMNSTAALGAEPFLGSADPCTGVPSNEFTHMGHTLRTVRWRYTEWPRWACTEVDVCAGAVDWSAVDGVELYDHLGDDGSSFDDFENANVAADPANAQLVRQLSAALRAGPAAAIPAALRP